MNEELISDVKAFLVTVLHSLLLFLILKNGQESDVHKVAEKAKGPRKVKKCEFRIKYSILINNCKS